jgi:hypothetical protein
MTTAVGPDVVDDGLVLSLDAANGKSYPGTGTTWTDLSGNGNTGTLSGGYSISENSMYFDGTGRAVISGLNTTLYTFEIVFRNFKALTSSPETDNSPNYSVVGFTSGGSSNRTIGLGSFAGAMTGETISWWTNPPTTGSYITDNISYAFHHLLINYNSGTSTYDMWIDGIKRTVSNGSGSPLMTNFTAITIGASDWFGSYYYFKGNIALARVYNAALTDAQVIQNYNALRGRFGL